MRKEGGEANFADRLRRMTMLELLRRSAPREIFLISDDEDPIPEDLDFGLWLSMLRHNCLH